MYFDNVGGDVLQAVMERLAANARVALCGLMDQYNREDAPPGPNPGLIIRARATVRGLVVYDHEDLRPRMEQELGGRLRDGSLAFREACLRRTGGGAGRVLQPDGGGDFRQDRSACPVAPYAPNPADLASPFAERLQRRGGRGLDQQGLAAQEPQQTACSHP